MVDYVEQVDDAQLTAFSERIQAKCQKYRNAVAKDKAKQQTLLIDLEKDFGGRIDVLKSIHERKHEVGSTDAAEVEQS